MTVLPKIKGVSPRGQKVRFFHLMRADGWIDGCYRFFRPRFFPHRSTD